MTLQRRHRLPKRDVTMPNLQHLQGSRQNIVTRRLRETTLKSKMMSILRASTTGALQPLLSS